MTISFEARTRWLCAIVLIAALAACATASGLQGGGIGMGAVSLRGTPFSQGSPPINGIGGVVSPKALSIMAVGLVLARLSWNLEDPDRMGRFFDQNIFNVTDVGDIYGDGVFLTAGVLGLAAAGRATRSERLIDFSSDLSRSLLLSSGATWALKLSVGRERPNGGSYSFPSGHTSAAFCIAPVVARHFGWKAAVPAYVLAGFTGIARMEDWRHYLSDVVFGAAIGLAAGDMVAGGGASSLFRYLSLGPSSVGLSLSF